jgi:hypothetical protein
MNLVVGGEEEVAEAAVKLIHNNFLVVLIGQRLTTEMQKLMFTKVFTNDTKYQIFTRLRNMVHFNLIYFTQNQEDLL